MTNPTLRQRASGWLLPKLFPGTVTEMGRMVDIFEDAYQRGGMLVPPDKIMQSLQENGQLTDLLIRLRGSVFALGFQFTDRDRQAAIEWHEFAYATNVNIESAVNMWTDFGMGQAVTISSLQPAVATILDEFWTAHRNRPVLGVRNQQDMSINALNEGELAFAFWFSPMDGIATIRQVLTKTLEVVWEDKVAKTVPLFYIQQTPDSALYFPDWLATPEQLDNVEIPPNAKRTDRDDIDGRTIVLNDQEVANTQAVMLWANRNKINGRGSPQFMNGLEWAKVLQQFMGDRAAVSRKAAMYTETVTVDGGSRVIDSIQRQLGSNLATSADRFRDTNPPPAAASDWIQNEAISREWQTRDTGATSARFDGQMLAGQLSVNTGVPMHWMGFPQALSNRSTAQEMKIPWLEQIKRYKTWLGSIFEDIGRVVLKLIDDNTNATIDWEKIEIIVSMDTPLSVMLDELRLVMSAVIEATKEGTIESETGRAMLTELFNLALKKVGAANPSTLTETSRFAFSQTVEQVMANYRNGRISNETAAEFLIGELYDVVGQNGHVIVN